MGWSWGSLEEGSWRGSMLASSGAALDVNVNLERATQEAMPWVRNGSRRVEGVYPAEGGRARLGGDARESSL